MKPSAAIAVIRNAILEVKSKKQEHVSVDALLNYLNDLDEDIDNKHEFDEASFRAEHERNLTHYEVQQQHSLEMWRSVITFALGSIKSAMLINGGGAVALLAFIGNIWVKGIADNAVASITFSIAFFSFGVLAASIGSGTTYVAQYCYAAEWEKTAISFHVSTVIIIFLSYILFGFGAYEAYMSFSEHLHP